MVVDMVLYIAGDERTKSGKRSTLYSFVSKHNRRCTYNNRIVYYAIIKQRSQRDEQDEIDGFCYCAQCSR